MLEKEIPTHMSLPLGMIKGMACWILLFNGLGVDWSWEQLVFLERRWS